MKNKQHIGKIVITLLFCLIQLTAFSQEQSISGKVTTTDGEGLPGVSIVIKGTTSGSITDLDGNYTVTVPNEDAVLVFSYIGFSSEEFPVQGVTVLDVTLEEDLMELDEIVVIGYGVAKKSDLTGATSSLKEDDFNIGAANPEQLIQGRVAGVQITSNSGEPGAGVQIRVRGSSTIRSGQQPLYIIDGVPIDFASSSPDNAKANGIGGAAATNPLNFINPGDIESIDILKDASSAAIYGARAANGVILITTKKGKEGKSNINYSNYLGISKLPKKLPVLSAEDWLKVRIDTLDKNPDDQFHYGGNTDWQDEIFRTAITHNHDLSISGGTQKGTYRASLNYLDQEGIIKNSDLKKLTGRLNITQKGLNDRLLIEATLTGSQIFEERPPVGATGFEGDVILNALGQNPTWPVYDSITGDPFQTGSPNERNPVAMIEFTNDQTKTTRLIGNVNASFEIISGLRYKISVGGDYTNAIRRINQSGRLDYLAEEQGRGQVLNKELSNYIVEHTLNYNKSFGVHSLGLLAGYSYQQFTYQGYNVQTGGIITDKQLYTDILEAGDPDLTEQDSYFAVDKMQSYFGRVNYNLMEKYLLTATVRQDGSSKFGKNNKYGVFPSFAAAWRLSQEEFIRNLGVFNNLKLRVGWGQTGNSEIGGKNSQVLLALTGSAKAVINNEIVPGFGFERTPNPDLKWETTTSTNIGLDFGFFKGRLSGTLDYFHKKTTDLLIELPAKPVSPAENVVINTESYIVNTGIELGLNAVVVANSNFNWDVNVNFTHIKNNVGGLEPNQMLPTGRLQGKGLTGELVQVITNDQPMNTFRVRQTDSIGADNGRVYYKKGMSGQDTLLFSGSAIPKVYWSINNTFRYKNFDFSFFIEAVHGHKIFNNTAIQLDKNNFNQAKNALDYFVEDNVRFTHTPRASDRYLEDGGYVRLSNATLGYNFNVEKLEWIQRFRLYVSGTNLLLFTNYKGYDPDVNTSADERSVKSFGVDLTSYPRARTFLFGLNVTFNNKKIYENETT